MEIDVKWDANVIRRLKKLGRDIASRIVRKVDDIKLNPNRYIFSLVNLSYSKIRVGDYRVFVEFHDGILRVQTIKHRKNAYKK